MSVAIAASFFTAAGCSGGGENVVVGTSGDGDGDGDGAGETSCSFECTVENVAEDCCHGGTEDHPPDGFPAESCPGTDYPSNWSCVDNRCVNDCTSNSDCLLEGYECHDVDGHGVCFQPCSNNVDCKVTNKMAGTECIGVVDDPLNQSTKFCKQP